MQSSKLISFQLRPRLHSDSVTVILITSVSFKVLQDWVSARNRGVVSGRGVPNRMFYESALHGEFTDLHVAKAVPEEFRPQEVADYYNQQWRQLMLVNEDRTSPFHLRNTLANIIIQNEDVRRACWDRVDRLQAARTWQEMAEAYADELYASAAVAVYVADSEYLGRI